MSPLCEDGGERKEGSPMYLRMVGQKERKCNKEQLHAAGPVLCAHWQWQHQAQPGFAWVMMGVNVVVVLHLVQNLAF